MLGGVGSNMSEDKKFFFCTKNTVPLSTSALKSAQRKKPPTKSVVQQREAGFL